MRATRTRFGLTLMVNHACNLRCRYCYTGAKFSAPMPTPIAQAAIDRAFTSLGADGQLDLSFFGGEPLLESGHILEWMSYARSRAHDTRRRIRFNLTTNGTITTSDAWRVMMTEDLDLAVSFDGTPAAHDQHRLDVQGNGSATAVEETLRELIERGKRIRINVVLRPDTLELASDGLIYLHAMGVREVDLSLDLWTRWNARDGARLEEVVSRLAELWRSWLPGFSVNWFDTKLGALACLPIHGEDTRCGFGEGEVAVAPSGRLYPCERLIGDDEPGHPLCLPGHALHGRDFLGFSVPALDGCQPCSGCQLRSACDTVCRCSNYVRTGNVNRPDGLLCILNKATTNAVAAMISRQTQKTACEHEQERL